ncbi:MAG: DUF5596 domain-containing protein [Oscillospiraceae bacterium]|nr:DUF5596 domain-containing protein [Oscillospiraceae bacterium]
MEQQKILEILKLSPKTEKAVISIFSKKQFADICKTAYSGEAPNFPLLKRKPLTRLAVVVGLLCEKYEDYKSLGITENIIAETFRDVKLRAELYEKKIGKPGISRDDVIWFRHIMNINIFKVGVLQFQTFKMVYLDEDFLGETYMVFAKQQKLKLPPGTNVINCHIQQGADLSTEAVNKSFSDAQAFFQKIFPETIFKAFLCYSWLLYPDMIKMLPKTSNIKALAGNFEIIGKVQDSDQAFENLFGKAYKQPPKIENSTSLQKLAAKNPKIFGFACGVRYL